jgi:triosephosphate isomerase (TIM)
MRKPLIVANWKENKTNQEAAEFILGLKKVPLAGRDVVVAPSFLSIITAFDCAKGSDLMIAAQDVSLFDIGAYTGEVSAQMLKGFCTYCIIGHSERRKSFGVTDHVVNEKVFRSLASGIKPIICIGERLKEREMHHTEEVLVGQLHKGLSKVSGDQMVHITIAYEPVWAISGGDAKHEPATPDTAQKTHLFIRKKLAEMYSPAIAERIRIIYGGSVKPDNAMAFMKQPDIDGALVGNASLELSSFIRIINF